MSIEAVNKSAELLGSLAEVARLCGVSRQFAHSWKHGIGVPVEHCVIIEEATKGAVMRWDLRPDDWHKIWPELRKHKDAPKEAAHG